MCSKSIDSSTGSGNVFVPKKRIWIALFAPVPLLLPTPAPQQPLEMSVMPAHLQSVQRLVEDGPWATPVGAGLGRVGTQDWGAGGGGGGRGGR